MSTKEKKRKNIIFSEDLPIAIVGEAKPVTIEEVKPGINYATQRADDEFLIINRYDPSINYMFAGMFLFLAAIGFLFGSTLDVYIFSGILASIAAFQIFYGYTKPNKEFILDRQNGLFTVPGYMWSKPITFPFKETVAHIGSAGWPPSLTLRVGGPKLKGYTAIAHYNQIQTWNLLVWYMDRNRPLPPGTAFDPYRQKDYERRKKAGFPPPLFDSAISIAEWVPNKGKGRQVNSL